MKDRTAAEMNRVSIAAFKEISADKRRTFTFDNGKEFSNHEQMAKALVHFQETFFARGSNKGQPK